MFCQISLLHATESLFKSRPYCLEGSKTLSAFACVKQTRAICVCVCVCVFFTRGLVCYNLSSIVYHYMESNLDYSGEKKLPSTVSSLTKPRFIDLSKAIELYQQNLFEHRPLMGSIFDQSEQSFVYGEFLKSAITCFNLEISSNCDLFHACHCDLSWLMYCPGKSIRRCRL